jgi:hypothetical protein
MTANGIYQMIPRRGRRAGVDAWTHRFRRHFSHTWLDRGGAEGVLVLAVDERAESLVAWRIEVNEPRRKKTLAPAVPGRTGS